MAKILRDDVDRFFEHNVDISSRTIYMGSMEVDGDDGETGTDYRMAEYVIKGLHVLDSQAENGDKPITILMNNPGGDEYHGLAIFDAIQACKNYVYIKVFGHAMSMGSIILQAADERVMSPNARIMIHYGTPPGCGDDHAKNFYRWAEESKKFDKWMEDLYLKKIKEKHPRYTRAKLKETMNFDYFLTAKEAVDFGLADRILNEDEF